MAFLVVSAAAPLGFLAGYGPLTLLIGGPGAATGFVLGGLALATFLGAFTAMTPYVKSSGAFYAYITTGLGRAPGTVAAVLAVVAYNLALVGALGAIATYLGSHVDELVGGSVPWPVVAALATIAVFAIAACGIDIGTRVLGLLLLLETAVIMIVVVAVLVKGGAHGLTVDAFTLDRATAPGMGAVLALTFVGFLGIEGIALYRSEARHPDRTIRRAGALAVGSMAAFYALVTWVIVQAFGTDQVQAMAEKYGPDLFFVAADLYVGPWAATALQWLIITSLLAAQLAFHNSGNRYLHALARDRVLPRRLATAGRRTGAPWVAGATATVVSLVGIAIAALLGWDPYFEISVWLLSLAVVLILLLQLMTCVAVVAFFLRPDAWPGRTPHRHRLDRIVGTRPAVVRFFDGHSLVASSRALELARTNEVADSLGPALVVQDEAGPTGVLREPAGMAHLANVIPPTPVAEDAAQLHMLLAHMAEAGLTTVHSMDLEGNALEILAAAETLGELPVRLLLSPWCGPDLDAAGWAELAALRARAGRRWAIRGVKLFLDGTIDHGTAWLSRPDRAGESRASLWPDVERYAAAVRFFDAQGIGTATHAIGDASVRCALNVIRSLRREGSTVVHRIEHIETIPDELLPQFAAAGAVAGMQPTHCTRYITPDAGDNWSARLTREQYHQGWRTRDLREHGATVALGSDWPVAHYDPRQVMADAQVRRPAESAAADPVGPEQRLTARMALDGYTTHAAAADDLAAELGTLAPGALADLTVFAADPLELPPEELLGCPVLATFVDGRPSFPAT